MVKTYVSLLIVVISATAVLGATDRTLEEKAVGKDVVEATVAKIQRASFFEKDYDFIRRLAYVETEDGLSNFTFTDKNYGGIWNLAQIYVGLTVSNPKLADYHRWIAAEYNIEWGKVDRTLLTAPLYSGLAARLYMVHLNYTVPQSLEEQARYWDAYFNRNDFLNWEHFLNKSKELGNITAPCSGKMDLVMVVDGSSSINNENSYNFDITKQFLTELIGTFSDKKVRNGLIVFGSEVFPIFPLDNYLSSEELINITLGVEYPNTKTYTNGALLAAAKMFQEAEPRYGIPQVMTIFTDGKSNPVGVDNIEILKSMNVSSYAIGITRSIDLGELETLAYNVPGNVFALNNFEVLAEFFRLLNAEVCKIPQKPQMDVPVQDTLNLGERRYYEIPDVPEEGITISLATSEGSTAGYWSFSEINPSSAINDGELSYRGTHVFPPNDTDTEMILLASSNTLYLAVEGQSDFNNYTITILDGIYDLSPPTEAPPTAAPTTGASPSVPPPSTTQAGGGAGGFHVSVFALSSIILSILKNIL